MIKNAASIFAPRRRILKKAKVIANKVEDLKDYFRKMPNNDLSNMTNIFIERLKKGETLNDIMPEAFAVAREAIYRVTGLFAYKVQIIGAVVAH
ncbi:MAG: hypothetical protein K2M43_00160 [Mycoplasmoidaceae bacterium]|nr:hypothetical protein [Mycoplasmoidaceae bacterium]